MHSSEKKAEAIEQLLRRGIFPLYEWQKTKQESKEKMKKYCSKLGAAAEQKMSYKNNFTHLHLASGSANKIFISF